jgi:hypothetical protein
VLHIGREKMIEKLRIKYEQPALIEIAQPTLTSGDDYICYPGDGNVTQCFSTGDATLDCIDGNYG